jgi:SAM-dependent methyltransferase
MKYSEVNCAICGAGLKKSKIIYMEFNLNIVRCLQCGLVYVNPRLAEDELDVVYGRHQGIKHGEHLREDKTRAPMIFIKYETRLVNERLRNIAKLRNGKLGRVLDIGSQHGHFLNLARLAGWIPVGVEMTTEFAENTRKEFGIEVYNDKIENVNFEGQYFDLVTFFDVFEHVQDPNSVLEAIQRIMKEDSHLMIKVPNVNFILLKTFALPKLFGNIAHKKYDFVNPLGFWMAQEHLYNYSDTTLQKMLSKHGFVKLKSYMEFPSIYGGNKYRDLIQVLIWVMSIVINKVTLGRININRALVYIFVKGKNKQ